mmetsp:Transcript_7971/g.49241  ORF Transcript_7971/g.49241 Transcript_7971/m.49241 type:complete len:543 (+) Transcript_7971:758-2386(+)
MHLQLTIHDRTFHGIHSQRAGSNNGVGAVQGAADIGFNVLVTGHVRPRVKLLLHKIPKRGRCRHLPCELDPFDQRRQIAPLWIGKVPVIDPRSIEWVVAPQRQGPLRFGTASNHLEGDAARPLDPCLLHHPEFHIGGHPVRIQRASGRVPQLQVRELSRGRLGSHESAVVAPRGGQGSTPEEQVIEDGPLSQASFVVVHVISDGDVLGSQVSGEARRLILQVLTHSIQCLHHIDSVLSKLLFWSYAGEEQEVRGIDGPAGQDHFPFRFHLDRGRAHASSPEVVFHSHGFLPIEHHFLDVGVGDQMQVGAIQGRLEVRFVGVPSPPFLLGHLERSVSFLGSGPIVEFGIVLHARHLGSLEELLIERIVVPWIFHADGSIGSSVFPFPLLVVFATVEPREHLFAGPSRHVPSVVVFFTSAMVQGGVGGRGATHHFATCQVHFTSFHLDRRPRVVFPIQARVLEQPRDSCRNGHQRAALCASSFQQQHVLVRIFRETTCQDTSGRTAAHHHGVVAPRRTCRFHGPSANLGTCLGNLTCTNVMRTW